MRAENRYKYWYILPLAALAWNELVFYGGRFLARGLAHMEMTTALDGSIPLLPWTVAIYFGCFVFWAACYLLYARRARAEALRFFAADFITKAVCLVFFIAMPTVMERPEVTGGGFWDAALRFLYRIDEPNNLFPSIHCAVSWLCWTGARGRGELPAWFRAAAFLMALAVSAATLTTKQHVIADVLSGIALAELSWYAAGRIAAFQKGRTVL